MKHNWMLKNEEEACNVFSLSNWNDMFVAELLPVTGEPLHQLMEFEGTRMRWYPDVGEMKSISGKLIRKLAESPGISETWRRKTMENCALLHKCHFQSMGRANRNQKQL